MCLSRQSERRVNEKGKLRPVRSKENALALKAVWIDVDIKPGAYNTLEDAVDAIKQASKALGIPGPTALVSSGGGLHCYWISDRELSPAEWQPYADGLKEGLRQQNVSGDLGLTGDSARILRVPGTFNRKQATIRPVELKGIRPKDYDFATDLAPLARIAPPAVPPAANRFFDPALFPKGAVASEFLGLPPESLADGIEHLVDPTGLEQLCGWYNEAIQTGGKDFGQGLWMLSTLAATFMKDGNQRAHAMAKGHSRYTFDETEAMWQRKVAERQSLKLGWPSCKAFQNEGCKHCATCPHFGKGKSPLNLAQRADEQGTNPFEKQVENGEITPAAALLKLRDQGAKIEALLYAVNKNYAVVKYGTEIRIATIVGKEMDFMKVEHFHNMLANVIVTLDSNATTQKPQNVPISKLWFKWGGRRQYIGRGAVFEPGGPLQTENDMLNLWRGFGVEPKQGDWSLMYNHILYVICRGDKALCDYIIKWMAYGVQYPDRPADISIATRGEEGAGKGFVWRNYGKFFGKHFKHIINGEQLTGRFNGALGEACAVFLDEALWAGDRKGEQILKALTTEDTFQLERKFCDPIPVKNHLRIMIASNNDWIVPVGLRGRRNLVVDVSDQYANESDPASKAYWAPLQAQFGNYAPDDGRAAMLYDLLRMDLSGFNVRAVPTTAAKTEQKLLSLRGTLRWLFEALAEGAMGRPWGPDGLTVSTVEAYGCYTEHSKLRREHPDGKPEWSKAIRKALGTQLNEKRPTVNGERFRLFSLAPLDDCRRKFARHIGDPDMTWDQDQDECSAEGPDVEPDWDLVAESARIEETLDRAEYEPDLEPDYDLNWDLAEEGAGIEETSPPMS